MHKKFQQTAAKYEHWTSEIDPKKKNKTKKQKRTLVQPKTNAMPCMSVLS